MRLEAIVSIIIIIISPGIRCIEIAAANWAEN